MLIAGLMTFEVCNTCIAYAANEIADKIDPTRNIVLDVPEKYQDGGNWFFIAQPGWTASEKSSETLYIPVQRTGDLGSEADITLKVIDLSAKHDVNYTAELYNDDTEAQIAYADMSVKELTLSDDVEIEEVEPTDENNLGQMINEMGGADITDGSGSVIGSVKATPLDEDGNPIIEAKTDDEDETPAEEEDSVPDKTEPDVTISQQETDIRTENESGGGETLAEGEDTAKDKALPEFMPPWHKSSIRTEDAPNKEDAKMSPTQKLRAARSAYTGTESDRQELEGGEISDLAKMGGGNTMSEDEFNKEMADAVADGYPGKEYALHFGEGENVKYLAVTPLYSDAAEGDAQIMLMLKKPSGNFGIGEDTNPVSITIIDEDEPEPVKISMASDVVTAEGGKAKITVNREGRLNAMKGVMVSSWGGSAKAGDEYSGIGAKLYFPMGIKSRTVEIPVYHGTEQKDFYVTITALDDETVETETTHVIIPEADSKSDGELMGESEYQGKPFTDLLNIRDGSGGHGFGFDGDTGFYMSTPINKEETSYVHLPTSKYGYAYDGMYVHFNCLVNWCDGEFRLSRWNPGGTNIQANYFDDGGKHDDHWLRGYWGDVKAPAEVTVEAANVDNEGPVGTDSYAAMWVDEVRLIKRQFDIKVENPEVKPLIGMSDAEVLSNYEAVMLDNSAYNSRTLWTEDSFALTAKDTKSPLRLVGVEAKIRDGKDGWYRIATINGKSDTAAVVMNQATIDAMVEKGCIEWSANGSGYGGTSYKGSIIVRPVFDYINATVELKNGDENYGTLYAQSPTPSMLWDFNSDRKMDDVMGVNSLYPTNQVSWQGEKSGGNDYYTFTASGGDPYVPIATHAESLENIRYVKIRARNLNDADRMELFGSINYGYLTGNAHINIPLESDTQWHEYVVDIKKADAYMEGGWNGRISYMRLDPMAGNTNNGSQIQIDYMAFFPDEGSANAFRRVDPDAAASWDFNGSDMAMDSKFMYTGSVSWSKYNGSDADAYVFNTTPGGGVGCFALRTDVPSVDKMRYMKIRIKNLNDRETDFRIFASINDASLGPAWTRVRFDKDPEWREYVFDITQGEGFNASSWNGAVSWLRFDLGWDHGTSSDNFAIDYIAFFEDEAKAKAYQPAKAGSVTGPVQLTYHFGDKLNFTTEINGDGTAANMAPDGVYYELRKSNQNGELINFNDAHYINNSVGFKLTDSALNGNTVDHPYYSFKPTFTEKGNRITVIVPDEYYDNYLDTTKGLFAEGNYVSVTHKNGAYYYVISEDILTNDIYELDAFTKDAENVIPKWILSDGSEYFGNSMYIRSNPRAKDNAITLRAATGSHLTYMTLSGNIVSSTMNLASGRSATDLNPANGAVVSMGVVGAVTDEDGKFTVPAVLYDSNAKVRFLVTYNGVTTIQEAKVPSNNAEKSDAVSVTGKQVKAVNASAGIVRVDTYSETGAHFTSAIASQRGQLQGTLHAVTLNGKELIVSVKVDKGGEYTVGNKTYTENIKDVTLYFENQETGEVHGVFSSNETPAKTSPAKWSWDEEKGEFTLVINEFDPAHPTLWTYGDVLMARLTTDKKTAVNSMGEDSAAVKDMVYDPVSTGYGVYADPNYEPMNLNVQYDDIAGMLGVEPKTDEDGNLLEDDTRYSFGAFPYIGEITAAVKVVSKVVSTLTAVPETQQMIRDLENMADYDQLEDEYDKDGNLIATVDEQEDAFVESTTHRGTSTTYRVLFSVFFITQNTFYGGVRFMVGVVAATGGGKGYYRQSNPFKAKAPFSRTNKAPQQSANDLELIHEDPTFDKARLANNASEYGGAHFKISAYIGFYLDYGYIEISKNGGAEKSHDMVFMGAGGFIGFTGSLGYTWAFMLGPIPAYFNLEAGIGVTFFIGSSADPNKTLESFKDSKELKGQDFGFSFEIKGNAYITGTIGVGLYKVFGVRVSAGVAFELGYSPNIEKWYPGKFDSNFGYISEATFAGTIDLMVTSIDLYSASWPLPLADGYLYYFQEVRRGNLCISYVENGMQDTEASEAEKAEARRMIKELSELIDNDSASVETIMEKTKALKNYAYDHDMLSWVAKNRIEMNKQGGIIGSSINGALQDDTDASGIHFHTNGHVDPKWVANDGQLMAAFSAVETKELVKNAYAQPSSRIINLGGGRFLMVFLDDTVSRDKQQAATLKWTVFDGSTWSEPQTVQNDSTADGKPNLVDAGDKVILSWSSMTDAKYETLKNTVKQELTDAGKSDTDIDVQEALEKDPARVMKYMDIFTAEFDKANGTFGEITQLTDDEYYDDNPQAVYDTETKDYIVMYYKTAQDDEDYGTAGDKLMDAVGASADPDKSYSVIAYMLYNGTKDEGDPFDVGWVTKGLYDNELPDDWQGTGEEFVAQYGPERFLPSAITYDNGKYADPPIYDLTTAQGYNGLAAFAFTVDKDFSLNTAEDRELYMQLYNFAEHSTYVPICVAGENEYEEEIYNSEIEDFETKKYTAQVEVGSPKLVRNGGNTFLFWRESDKTLKYLNISDMLNAKVAAVAEPSENEDDWTYALKEDGTFATDAATGITYTPNAQEVDFGSLLTSGGIEITDYEVIADKDDNLYVVWTDAVTHEETDEIGRTYPVASQAIYASAMIHQDERSETYTDENDETQTRTESTVRWSKPYRLTRENNFNDGLALTLDDEGNLMIVHNQYTKQTAESEDEMMRLIKDGKMGITYDNEGNAYAPTISYNSPVSLMVTKCEKIGSLEASRFAFSDDHPVPGEIVEVTAAMENVGLTDAEGSKVEFYEYKDGVQGRKIYSYTSDARVQVNTAKTVSFLWEVPDEGADGYQIGAVVQEKNSSGGYYPAVTSCSDTFKAKPVYTLKINDITQEGDKFRVDYSVINTGNAPSEDGTKVSLRLTGLHGDLDSERYGNIKNDELYSTDLDMGIKTTEPNTVYNADEEGGKEYRSSTVHNAKFNENVTVDIPVSVFKFCGYDAVQLVLTDAEGNVTQESDQSFVSLDNPVNLSLNGGENVSLSGNDKKQVTLEYDSTVFMNEGKVLYSVDDPTIASVDENGNITGLKNGKTELTATVLPSGRSETIEVTVSGIKQDNYTVTFNANGGSGEMEAQSVAAEKPTALTKNAYTNGSNTFKGWNTEADGSGTSYKDGEEITLTDDITLYAQWAKKSSGGGGGGSSTGSKVNVYNSGASANGKVSVSKTNPSKGETVTVTVTPDEGYELDKLIVTDSKGNEIEVTKNADGTFSFVQPDGKVTVKAEYKKTDTEQGNNGGEGNKDWWFKDVPETAWYYAPIKEAFDAERMSGMSEDYFEPETDITRGMFAYAIYRREGLPETDAQNKFEDVKAATYYETAIAWATENGIVAGYDDTHYGPDDHITREQMAAILYRYAQFKDYDVSVGEDTNILDFTDALDISEYAIPAIQWAVGDSVITGFEDGTMRPRANANRAQMAVILNKIADLF